MLSSSMPLPLITLDTFGKALAVAAVSTGIWVVYRIGQSGRRAKDLPPGPPTIPLLGNLHLFPTEHVHYQYKKWAEEYGDVYSVLMGSKPIIVLSSPKAIREVMDENSAITSDRASFYMVDIISPQGTNLAMGRYNDSWRSLRRAAQELLTAKACKAYIPVLDAESSQLMFELLTQPERFAFSIRRYSASFMFSVLFGKRTPRFETKEVTDFFHTEHLFQRLLDAGEQPPIDMVPILKYVPEWMGAKWKASCRNLKELRMKLWFGLLTELEERNATGDCNGSCMERVIERSDEWGLTRDMIGWLGGVLVQGGSETTASFLLSVILALCSFPDVQKQAQEEMDRVVGRHRVPSIEDIDQLPYLQAIINETHRFRPPIPMGIPHANIQDMTYRGYHIPAGSFIYANIWALYQDEECFENPSEFNPDRFMRTKFGTCEGASSQDEFRRHTYPFGAGRRICPGIHLAQSSIIIVVAKLLWGFTFSKAKHPITKEPIEIDIWGYTSGLGSQPLPFKCSILPRSDHHAEMISYQFKEAAETLSQFESQLSGEDRAFVEKQREELGVHV